MIKLIKITLLAFTALGLVTCNKDKVNPVNAVPVYLDFNINYELSELSYNQVAEIIPYEDGNGLLVLPSGVVHYINQPVFGNGLFLYKVSIYDYRVYDRSCTYGHDENCSLSLMSPTGFYGECPCCNSRFELFGGTVVKGPAALGLYAYSAEVYGDVLYLRN